jgi:hypothetical protein
MSREISKNVWVALCVGILTFIATITTIISDSLNIGDRIFESKKNNNISEYRSNPISSKQKLPTRPKIPFHECVEISLSKTICFNEGQMIVVDKLKGFWSSKVTYDTTIKCPIKFVSRFVMYRTPKLVIEYNRNIPADELPLDKKFRRGDFYSCIENLSAVGYNIEIKDGGLPPSFYSCVVLFIAGLVCALISRKVDFVARVILTLTFALSWVAALIVEILVFKGY